MKKIIILLLGVSLLSTSILLVAFNSNNLIRNIIHYFKSNKIEPAIVTDELYQWLDGKDLSGNDLTDKKETLLSSMFDTKTKWPVEDKMPQGFDPSEIIKWGKKNSLMLTELHKQGYTGEGINIAVIDGVLIKNHNEIKENLIHYEEIQNLSKTGINFHGTAVSSIAVGKNVGVAPGANLYYFAIFDNPEHNKYQANVAQAIKRVIQFNNNNRENKQIRLIVSAEGYNRKYHGGEEYFKAVKYARQNNILVLEPNFNAPENKIFKLYIFGANCTYPLDKNDYNNYKMAWVKEEFLKQLYLIKEITDNADNWDTLETNLINKLDYLKIHNQGNLMFWTLLDNLNQMRKEYKTIDNLNNYIKGAINYYTNDSLHVPSSGITIASDKGKGEYIFDGQGGISWALPYYAGVAALALQIKPELSNDELIDLIDKTAVVNDSGLKMIAPQEVVKRLTESK